MQAALLRLGKAFRRRTAGRLPVELGAIRVPDSAVCKSATELLASTSEPWLANHCLRTFLWAAILGRNGQYRFDEEALFVASALHDLGLTTAGAGLSPHPAECFAVEGAWAAEQFLASAGLAPGCRETVAEAICLHMNVSVPPAQGIEAHLLHEGAALDVVGARLDEVAAPTRREVLRAHPRLEIKERLAEAMTRQSVTRPRSRAAFLCRHGFISMIRHARFEAAG